MSIARASSRLVLALSSAIVALACALLAAARPGGDSSGYAQNLSRLRSMTPDKRRALWAEYDRFLALPAEEQERLRRLQRGLRALPPDRRERYRAIMERYRKWKDELPLYERQMLEDATAGGTAKLYTVLIDVRARQQDEDRLRPYWLLPDRPGVRVFVSRILGKLSPEEIESLDQLPPLDRLENLLAYAPQLGLEPPAPVRPARPGGARGGALGPAAQEKWRKLEQEKLRRFLAELSREQLDELGTLRRPALQRRLLELYFEKYPEELPERRKNAAPETNEGNEGKTRPPRARGARASDKAPRAATTGAAAATSDGAHAAGSPSVGNRPDP